MVLIQIPSLRGGGFLRVLYSVPYFLIYTSPIEDILTAHGSDGIIYADDTQFYISIQPPKREKFLNCLEDCINDVCSWFTANKLMCNSTKSNFIYFYSKFKPTP